MGGLKSLAAVVLIKTKIVLVVAALVALAVFTAKYLLGAAGLPGLYFKDAPATHSLPVLPPAYPHEPLYGYGYPTPIPLDHMNHEGYVNEWSKIGNGARYMFDYGDSYLNAKKIMQRKSYNHKRKRKRSINIINMYRYD